MDELVTRIKSTVYVNAVSKLEKPVTAEKIESALGSYLADMHYSLAKAIIELKISIKNHKKMQKLWVLAKFSKISKDLNLL